MGELQQRAAPRASTRNPTAAVTAAWTTTAPKRAYLAPLLTAAVASLLASSCCLLPLALASVGLTGVWLSHLRVLQPYSPILIGVAVAALALAAHSLFRGSHAGADSGEGFRTLFSSRSATTCRVDGVKPRPLYTVMFWLVAALTLLLLVTPVVAPWFY